MIESDNNTMRLPKGWVQTSLGEIAEINPKLPCVLEENTEVSFLPMKAIEELTGKFDASIFVPYIKVRKGYTAFINGDIIFAKITPCMENGKVAVAGNLKSGVGFGSTEFHVIRPFLAEFPRKYLFYYLIQESFRRDAKRYMTGSAGQLRVPAKYMQDASLPLPPLPEQGRIVAKLEELFTCIGVGVEGLRKVKAQLKRYRQAVLKYAFEGKLTEEWRKTHKDHTEPAQKLLEQMKNERRKDQKYKEQSPIDMSELPEVPKNWMWPRIGDLFDVGSGGTPSRRKPEYWKGNIPWVSSGEVDFCEIKSTKECITKEGLENSSAKFYPAGTVLMALYGEGKTRGQAAILRITATTNQAVACILCANSSVPPEYVYWWLYYRYYETRRIRQGANQPNMYLHHVREMAIPVAPLSEQKEIIQKIEESLSVADEIDRTVDSSLSQAERLRQCILKTAFEGGLVSQDPSDEPAEKLLERIQVESTKSRGEKDQSRRKKNKPKQLELSTYVE